MLDTGQRLHIYLQHFSQNSDVLNADVRILDNIDSYYTDPYCNIIPTQT